jgi:anaerobic magnesium-protoporphyrin IX monomethyl ester cyclase
VSGEGEIAFRSLVEHLIAGADAFAAVPNLFWSRMVVVQRPTVKAAPVDLESAPPPDWSAFDLRRYGLGMSSGLAAAIEISRGARTVATFATSIRSGIISSVINGLTKSSRKCAP